MGSAGPVYPDNDRIFDDVLGSSEGVDAQFVDSLLASLATPGAFQPQAQPPMSSFMSSAAPVQEPARASGSGHSAQDRHHLEREGSGGSSGSEGGRAHAAPSLRVREKNKRAQRAFRQRQKEKSQAMGRELREITEKLDAVTLERELLQQRNKLLEMALANSRNAKAQPSASDSAETEEIISAADRVPHRTSQVVPQLEPSPGFANSWDAGDFTLCTGHARSYAFSDDVVKKLTLEEIVHIWEELVTYMSELLVTANGDANTAAGRDLQQTVFSTIRLIARISTHNWRLKYSWLTQRIGGSLALLGYQSPQFHWPSILEAMHLAQWQKDKILEHRSKYLAALANIMQERQEVEQGLQSLALGKESVITVTQQHMALHNLAQRLGRLWQHTYQCMGVFFKVIWNEVFDSFQAANFAVQAYPWAPDTLALAARLAQEAGLPAAEDVLATRFPTAIMAAPVNGGLNAQAPPAAQGLAL